jgi:hypothetical protein
MATTVGLSAGQPNRDLFAAGQLDTIEWISLDWNVPHYNAVTIRLGEIAAEPAAPAPPATLPQELVDAFTALGQPIPLHVARAFAPPRQFPPSFNSEELLRIAAAQLPDPDQFLGREVIIDGITPVAVAFFLNWPCRKARSLSVNVPREGGVKLVWERNPQRLDQLVPGDMIVLNHQRPGATYKVASAGIESVLLWEQGRGRGGESRTIKTPSDIAGWT